MTTPITSSINKSVNNKSNKPLVIKIGGAILEKKDALADLLKIIASLKNSAIMGKSNWIFNNLIPN